MLVHDVIHLEPYVNEILEVLFEDSSYKKRVRRTLLETAPSHAAVNSVRMLRAGVDVRINSDVSRYSRSQHMNLCDLLRSGNLKYKTDKNNPRTLEVYELKSECYSRDQDRSSNV